MREKGPLLDFIAKEPRRMNPRIIIPNVLDYIGEEELIYELKTQNPQLIDPSSCESGTRTTRRMPFAEGLLAEALSPNGHLAE